MYPKRIAKNAEKIVCIIPLAITPPIIIALYGTSTFRFHPTNIRKKCTFNVSFVTCIAESFLFIIKFEYRRPDYIDTYHVAAPLFKEIDCKVHYFYNLSIAVYITFNHLEFLSQLRFTLFTPVTLFL